MQGVWQKVVALGLVLLVLLGGAFPVYVPAGMSRPEQVALAILLAAAILWVSEAVPLFVTSLSVLFLCLVWLVPAMRADGQTVEAAVFLTPFFSDIILLFLGGFVLASGLRKLNLDEQLARLMLRRVGSSLPLLLAGVIGVTAFFSMWLSNTATAAMMLALVLPVVLKLPAADGGRKALLLAVPLSANLGGLGTPIGSPPNAIAMQYMRQIDLQPSFATWMLIGVPGAAGLLILLWFTLRIMFRSNISQLPEDSEPVQFRWTWSVAFVAGTALLTIVGWVTSALHGYSTGTVAMIPVLAFFGTKLLSVHDLRSLSWDVLLLMGGGLCLGAAIAESGLAGWLVDRLPIAGAGVYLLMVIFGCVACLMSSVMSNTATANLLLPIVMGMQFEPRTPLFFGIAFACTMAMPLPVSTPPNAMAFSSGYISVPDLLKPGLAMTLIGMLLTFTLGYWWWRLIGLF